jgi:hypothetical protein
LQGAAKAEPDEAQLRRQAKELRDSARAGDSAALGRIAWPVAPHDAAAVTLASAQLTIAREHGFPSCLRLKATVEAQAGGGSPHLAAFLTASVTGWAPEAARLMAGDPGIGRASVFAAAALGRDAARDRPQPDRDLPGRAPSRLRHSDSFNIWRAMRWCPHRSAGCVGAAQCLPPSGSLLVSAVAGAVSR